jgi:L-ribulose-5-phosphate 3-epimerase UlaE
LKAKERIRGIGVAKAQRNGILSDAKEQKRSVRLPSICLEAHAKFASWATTKFCRLTTSSRFTDAQTLAATAFVLG